MAAGVPRVGETEGMQRRPVSGGWGLAVVVGTMILIIGALWLLAAWGAGHG